MRRRRCRRLRGAIYLLKGVLAKENAELVACVARLAKERDRAWATPDEARQFLRLGAAFENMIASFRLPPGER